MSLADGSRARAELAALADRYCLDPASMTRFSSLVEALVGDPHAPTAVTEPLAVVRDHVADSLVALELPELAAVSQLVDVGAGAGFPGLPLAIAAPAIRVTLLEASSRKVKFLAATVAKLGLGNATAVHARAESWSPPPGSAQDDRIGADMVTARAVAGLPVVLELAAPLLGLGGNLVVWRGRRVPEHEREAERAARTLGLRPDRVVAVAPYAGATDRHLHLFTKTDPTPARFPRRPGMATKRPLGRSGGPSA